MRRFGAVLVGSLTVLGGASPAGAIPAFARRYQVECIFCHEGFPKLNAVGQRFRERGFRLEREEGFSVDGWLKSVPLVVRANVNRSFLEGSTGSTTSFVKGISAGNLGGRFSYWVDDGLAISSGNTSHAKPDNAWLRYEVVEGGKLYAKAGRFELDLPFTQVRSPHLFGYDIYGANAGFETEGLGVYKDGLEVGGDLPRDVRWSAALVKGHSEGLSGGSAGLNPDLYLRIAKRVDRHRFGGFAYFGKSTLAFSGLNWDDTLTRVGADANVWIERLNLYGVFLYGRNSNSIATRGFPTGTGQALSFTGGFLQADYHPREAVALTLRLNLVDRAPFGQAEPKDAFSGLFPGVQIFIFQHGKVSFEYGFLNRGQSSFGAVQAEIAF